MIEESYVSFDTAKMLKEAGFKERVGSCFMYDDKADEYEYEFVNGYAIVKKALRDNYNGYENTISRPTQALAVRWLREEHHIFIMLTPVIQGWMYDLFDLKKHQYILCNEDAMTESYEAAFETALREAVKLIKK